jgi:hypothetical protein
MRLTFVAAALVVFNVGGMPSPAAPSQAQAQLRLAALPDNPCEILTAAQVSSVTGLEIPAVQRLPDIMKVVRAQEDQREPGPGIICSYETRSDLGAITIVVPTRAERGGATYWEARSRYFKTFPGSARAVAGLGTDAWLGGGNSLTVLVGDEYFALSTQLHQPRSRAVLIDIARAVLERF